MLSEPLTLSLEKRLSLYYQMLRIRLLEEAIADCYHEQEMRCPVHLSIGQEAVAVGVCSALSRDDYVVSTHRSHAHYLAKGGDLKALLAEIYGRREGCSLGRGGSMHITDPSVNFLGSTSIVGGTIPVGVGAAFGMMMQSKDNWSVVFLGEGATEEGVFAESMDFAALYKLSVVFVCENNFYSVCSPLSVRQSKDRDRLAIAKAHGLESFLVDGNDVEEVYLVMKDLLERQGPVYLECLTYRWKEHCGPNYDNHIGYRSEEEFQEWKKRCPIASYEQRLLEDGIDYTCYNQQIMNEIEAAFEFAKRGSYPEKESLLNNVYA